MIVGLRTAAIVAAVCSSLFIAPDSARAQSAAASSAAAADPEYQALFKRMFADPQNMEVTFRFAEVAIRLGDYEAAIGALERVLYYNPNLAEVKLELARLYLRIVGNQVAQSYIEQAIATPDAAPETVAAARQLLTQGDSGAPSLFSFFLYGGMRYQTNASAGPNSDLVLSDDGDLLPIDPEFRRSSDWNSFALASAAYSYDFGGGVSAELGLVGYYSKQVDLSEFDVGLVEVQAGPRVAVPLPMVSDASVKIYGIGTASTLAASNYFRSAGFGVSSRFKVSDALQLEPSYEYRDRKFKDVELFDTLLNGREQTGILHVLALNGGGTLYGLNWMGRLASSWNEIDDSDYEYNNYHRISADIAIPISFTLNWWETVRHFVFTTTAGFSLTDYAQPNWDMGWDVARRDLEWRVGASLDMQIDANFGVRTFVQYANIDSNLPNFEMDNLSVSIGPTFSY